jgi:polar amino acid transport system substrate-binding protein
LNLKHLAILYFFADLLTPLAFAKDIVVAFSPHKPPYVIGKEGRGLEIDIVREALALEGLTLKVDLFDRRYLRQAIKFNRTDAAAGLKAVDDGLYYSDAYIGFQNTIISRSDDGIKLDSIADLKGFRFAAWRGAYQVLGREFNEVSGNGTSPTYLEYDNQLIQNKMFWSRRIDLLIIDQFVFNWYQQRLADSFITTDKIILHPLLPKKTLYYIGFKTKEFQEIFNSGLSKLKQSGRYDELSDEYLKSEKTAPIYLYYDDRPPYLKSSHNGVYGLTATPAAEAFRAAGLNFKWKRTVANEQFPSLKNNEGKDCLIGATSILTQGENQTQEKYAQFTYPIYTDKPQVALSRKDNPIKADTLDELFSNIKKVMLVKEAYSYGQYVDQMVKKNKPKRLMLAIDAAEMLLALDRRKADYMLIAPEEIEKTFEEAGLNLDDFNTHLLSDIPSGEQHNILCSMKVSGETIQKLNQFIQKQTILE